MSINLQDLRVAVQSYMDTSVVSSISALTPAVPGTLNPNEEFTFSITVTNAPASSGGLNLENVRYHLFMADDSANAVAKLIVPPTTTAVARTSTSSSSTTLTPGSLVSNMVLFPTDSSLTAGDSDTISGLKGKAGGAVGSTSINFHVHADPSLDFLFPKSETNADATKTVSVV